MLNDEYSDFLFSGRRVIDGLSVLNENSLIPFKDKAWCELSARRKTGKEDNACHIHKHYRDVHKLPTLLPANERVILPNQLKSDM